jgi:hypothetical protein
VYVPIQLRARCPAPSNRAIAHESRAHRGQDHAEQETEKVQSCGQQLPPKQLGLEPGYFTVLLTTTNALNQQIQSFQLVVDGLNTAKLVIRWLTFREVRVQPFRENSGTFLTRKVFGGRQFGIGR